MTKLMARIRQSGSFIAGLLIGLAIVVATFAMADADSSAWEILWVFWAPGILALGLSRSVSRCMSWLFPGALRHCANSGTRDVLL